jgi:hypothetical protein
MFLAFLWARWLIAAQVSNNVLSHVRISFLMGKSPFLERVRLQIRLRHYSIRTEQSYLHWVYRFIIFKKTPSA